MALSIPELAKRLDVNESRARLLVQSGRIRGLRVGGRWIVDEADAAQFRRGTPAGRPLSERSAWLLITHLWVDSKPSLGFEMSPVEKHRLNHRIQKLEEFPDRLDLLAAWLVNRAEKFELSSTPADIAALRADPRIHLSGVSHPQSGLLSNSEIEAYVRRDDYEGLVRDWFLVETFPGKRPNVILRVAEEVPDELPLLVVAADLAERPGTREQQAARQILRSVRAD
ncbi:helix-turn-helix domain-containing protein [Paenarthrobacter sp. NPDC092416]|uniref:helix-turn-helix domain-containing protein n=1 Tax=Paenarthrobacter sp. NPDC092416 TaxID=3364386 RepID=UPI003814CD82